jgi:hypothetical protein
MFHEERKNQIFGVVQNVGTRYAGVGNLSRTAGLTEKGNNDEYKGDCLNDGRLIKIQSFSPLFRGC